MNTNITLSRIFKISLLIALVFFSYLTAYSREDTEDYTYKLSRQEPEMELWTTVPGIRVFKDDTMPTNTEDAIKMYAAKNEFEPCILIINPSGDGEATINVSGFPENITFELYIEKYVYLS